MAKQQLQVDVRGSCTQICETCAPCTEKEESPEAVTERSGAMVGHKDLKNEEANARDEERRLREKGKEGEGRKEGKRRRWKRSRNEVGEKEGGGERKGGRWEGGWLGGGGRAGG